MLQLIDNKSIAIYVLIVNRKPVDHKPVSPYNSAYYSIQVIVIN